MTSPLSLALPPTRDGAISALDPLEKYLSTIGYKPWDERYKITVPAEEALLNVAFHQPTASWMKLECEHYSDGVIRLTIEDDGNHYFDVANHDEPLRAPPRKGGNGIRLIKMYASAVSSVRINNINLLIITIR